MQSGQSAGSGESMAAKRARFEQLAMPAVNALYRQAMRLTNDPDDAQDLVQDTFERGFKAFDSFQPGSNFEAWMTTIERNAYFNQYAKAKRRPQRATTPPVNTTTGTFTMPPNIRRTGSSPLKRNIWTPSRPRKSWPRSPNSRRNAGRCSRRRHRRQVLPAGGR